MIHQLNIKQIEDVIITSVVPQVMYSISNAMRKYLKREPLIVGENIKVDILNKYDNPGEVGADRLVNAYAAHRKYKGLPLVIVDFGTATTFDVVDEEGAYLGGLIYPGIKISMEALFNKAAKLPKVELSRPQNVIGKNTVNSMQSGAIYGYVGAVLNIVSCIEEELGRKVDVIATGGLSEFIGKQAGIFKKIDKTLTLEGLYMIYNRYKLTK
jgi:type III pantothenate kinase